MPRTIVVHLKNLTPIWTGDVDRTSEQARETGLMGSIRWWTEALIRGLGGYACDPAGDDRCVFDDAAYARTSDPEDGLRDVCPACRLFGCSGWSSKLRLLVTDGEGGYEVNLSQPGVSFMLHFVELKPTLPEERWLLSKAIWLIARYGVHRRQDNPEAAPAAGLWHRGPCVAPAAPGGRGTGPPSAVG